MPKVKKASGKQRSINDIIPSALAALEKTIKNDSLPYESVPRELLVGTELNLSTWSLVVTDACLATITSNLTILDLAGAAKITDDGLQLLSGYTSNMLHLNLDNAFRITSLTAITKKCSNLQHLSLSGCMGIDGAGFGILGQNCRELISLKLSGCRQIKPWAFMKIFESCKRLQSLDISFCTLVTDQEMKVLADNASDLRQLNLRDCKLLSDVGLSYIALGCLSLTEINLRRSEMPFRITDVALLQLGQSCRALVSINLHGCEMISDTGLSWLSGWTKDLRHLDLSNCNKITNNGIRHIGEGCPNLRSIALSNIKRVSDVGLRCLATGCCQLEAIQASGLLMLSDGVDRTFGLEGIQALGQSNCARTMKHLNLRGCSLLSTLTMKAIGNCNNLETLDLGGCDKLTLEGAKSIGKSCKWIRQLSFGSCGDCISDAMVEVIVNHLDQLASVNLSHCPKIGDRSLKALSTCNRLDTLDLTGCTGVGDRSILQLCDCHFNPGLRQLYLAQCNKIGDTALVWIIDGLKQTRDGHVSLETLSLKGTQVTQTAVKGIRDRFPYSLLKSNSSFLGFWPLDRTDDRKIIDLYHKRACSAAIIQARVRSRRERDTLKRAREVYSKKKVAILIGALYRGRKARRLTRELRRARKERLRSVLLLQCAFRCRMSRKKRLRLRERKWLTIVPLHSTVIQRHWRGILGRRKAHEKREERLKAVQRQIEAATRIQACHRMMQARRIKIKLSEDRRIRELHRHQAALRLQCAWRKSEGVKELRRLKEAWQKQQEIERAAALRIAGSYLIILSRKALNQRVELTRKRLLCAHVIQRWYRDQKERISRNIHEAQQIADTRLIASVMIQRGARRRQAYLQLRALKQKRDAYIALRKESAITLCRWGRLCVAKIRTQRRRLERNEEIRRTILLKHWASTKIAAGWRGKLGRDLSNSARIARAHRWKAMFSKEEQKTFYYNQDTGETRWEKPQCLLDLEPKPICCNCADFLAEIECAGCEEFYCTKCFEFIHYGGKRQRHSFRLVYDYYGKRKDYDREPWQTELSNC